MSTKELPINLPIPLIETPRLVLRGHRRDDLPDCNAMWGDPDVVRHIGGKPFSAEEVWARVLRYVGHWCWQGYGFWAIVEKSTGRFVGEVGFADFKRDLEPSLGNEPEAGWVLATHAHGRGYATEAVQAAVQWGETRFGSSRTFCLISPGNHASVRVAEKCGFQRAGQATYKGGATLLFVRPPASLH